jgi:hypothetical protein
VIVPNIRYVLVALLGDNSIVLFLTHFFREASGGLRRPPQTEKHRRLQFLLHARGITVVVGAAFILLLIGTLVYVLILGGNEGPQAEDASDAAQVDESSR